MQLVITIRIGNAATVDDAGQPDTVSLADLLHGVAHKVEDGHVSGTITDYNGNPVGDFLFKD